MSCKLHRFFVSVTNTQSTVVETHFLLLIFVVSLEKSTHFKLFTLEYPHIHVYILAASAPNPLKQVFDHYFFLLSQNCFSLVFSQHSLKENFSILTRVVLCCFVFRLNKFKISRVCVSVAVVVSVCMCTQAFYERIPSIYERVASNSIPRKFTIYLLTSYLFSACSLLWNLSFLCSVHHHRCEMLCMFREKTTWNEK